MSCDAIEPFQCGNYFLFWYQADVAAQFWRSCCICNLLNGNAKGLSRTGGVNNDVPGYSTSLVWPIYSYYPKMFGSSNNGLVVVKPNSHIFTKQNSNILWNCTHSYKNGFCQLYLSEMLKFLPSEMFSNWWHSKYILSCRLVGDNSFTWYAQCSWKFV